MKQLLPVLERGQQLPPFRSATEFPIHPTEERLRQLYPGILQALKNTNVARRILRTRLDEKKQMMIDVRTEIERLEADLALEAETRIRLHEMNQQLLGALQEIEGVANDAAEAVINAHQGPRIRLRAPIEKLKNLMRRWRALKLQYRSDLANPRSRSGHD